MNTEEYLTKYHGWEGKPEGNAIKGCCPMHRERRPSFAVYPDDDHWYCFTEQRSGTFPGMVNILEFGDTNTTDTWVDVFNRVLELSGHVEEKRQVVPFSPTFARAELPYATYEQRAVLTAAMHWWYEQLWSPDPMHRGRAYFMKRGVSLPDLRFCVQLGYAPGSWSPEKDKEDYTSFARAMEYAVGTGWEPMATELGILSKNTGNLALRDRVMFCSTNDLGECVYFQSRQVQFTGERPKYPYLSAKGIRKVPFSLAIPRRSSTIIHVESPFGVAIMAPYGLVALGWHGGPSKVTLYEPWMRSFLSDRTHIIAMDNDVAHRRRGGELYYPGDHHAQVLQDFFDQEGYRSQRVIPPARHKGPDEWIQAEGIEPFLQQIVTLS